MNMRILQALPPLAAITAFIAWGLTLLQLAAFAGQLNRLSALAFVVIIAVAALLILSAQRSKTRASTLGLWLSAGLWTGAAYVSLEVIGLAYFLTACLTVGFAALREREGGKFSLSGPGVFIAAMLVIIIAFGVLSR